MTDKNDENDYQLKLEILRSYKAMYYRLQYINSKLYNIKSVSNESGGYVDGDMKNKLIDEKEQLENHMTAIYDWIQTIDRAENRYVIGYKFTQLHKLEDICTYMNYSMAQIRRFYKYGIKELDLNKYKR